MNGLPDDVNLGFLQERRLEQVCFGEHQTQLRFDNVCGSMRSAT